MVKFIVDGKFAAEQSKGLPGLASFYFDLTATVLKATATEFAVRLAAGPGLPPLPGSPLPVFPQNTPDRWFGKGLDYKDITLKGHTIETPFKGTITRYLDKASDYKVTVTGMKIDAEDFFAVSRTLANKDNLALNRKIFSKDDLIKGGDLRDKLSGFNGDDIVRGGAGNDRVSGGKGRDKVLGDKGNDILNGDQGNDILTGGKGSDDFVFKGAFGKDVIKDFAAKNPGEDIDLSGVAAIRNFRDLKANHLSQKGDDALITAGKNSIRLEDVDRSDLDAGDFLF